MTSPDTDQGEESVSENDAAGVGAPKWKPGDAALWSEGSDRADHWVIVGRSPNWMHNPQADVVIWRADTGYVEAEAADLTILVPEPETVEGEVVGAKRDGDLVHLTVAIPKDATVEFGSKVQVPICEEPSS